MLKINTISRPVFFVRNDKTIETNNTGEYITLEEFTTIISDGEVICVNELTGERHTYTPGEYIQPVTASVPDTVVVPETPAPDAGRVPKSVSTGSEDTQA
jgi:hypothetical protein